MKTLTGVSVALLGYLLTEIENETVTKKSEIFYLYAARAARGFGDGFAVITGDVYHRRQRQPVVRRREGRQLARRRRINPPLRRNHMLKHEMALS
jgi:hypothetical protein